MRLTIITALGALALAASTAYAERIHVPEDAATLQAAVDAARAGDEIVVTTDQIEGAGIRSKTDLTIRGKGKPVVGDIDIVGGRNIRIQGLVIEGTGGAALYLYAASDVTIRKCTIQDAPGNGILMDACRGIVVERCRVERVAECGILLDGFGSGRVSTDCRLSKNRIRGAAEVGIAVCDGVDTIVSKNVVTESDGGIYVGPREEHRSSGSTRASIHANRVDHSRIGIGVMFCSDNEVTANRCDDIAELAFFVAGNEEIAGNGGNNRFEKNRANRSEYGYFVASDDNVFVKNKTRLSSASGFFVVGMHTTRNVLNGNKALRSGVHGFYVMGTEHLLDANVASRSVNCGFYMDATGCRLTDNRAKKSGDFDLDDWRDANSYADNRFGTVAPPRSP